MLKSDLLFVLAIAAGTAAVWLFLNRPSAAPPWPETIAGYALSPLREDPARRASPSLEELDADLELLAKTAMAVRTYSLDGTLAQVPALAARHGLAVTLGVWLDEDRAANAARLERLRDVLASEPGNVTRVVVGNEVLLRAELPVEELAALLHDLKRELDLPVGTSEPWNVWMEHPELVDSVDFLSVHLLPYWEGVHAADAVEHVADRVGRLEAEYPGKPIVIGEVGWPSFGRSRADASASHEAAASFLRRFSALASREGYDYFLLEAFDQPWKRAEEGEVGAHWGIFDARRRPKFEATGPVVPIRGAAPFGLGSALVAAAVFGLLVADGRGLRAAGRAFLAATATALGVAILWSAARNAQPYWTLGYALGWSLSGAGILAVALLIAVEAHEWAESRWAARRREPTPRGDGGGPDRGWPKVSIHVPAHAEPPEMLIETLRSLAELDYPHFEVIVIDNNTADEAQWRPVQDCCARLGERFRFFHVAPLGGYKAGALNYALRQAAEDATIVAVIDSDYVVEPGWLRELVPHFDAPKVAIVQAPQAYRDAGAGLFKSMCEAEYRGFFHIGMATRNDRNAIIQHGTMTMIRRAALDRVGGWAEWTITEDAELGLRVLEHGYEAVYTRRCYGRGLTPDTFGAYKSQRYRWAVGAVQILRRYRRQLLGTAPSALTVGQRYHFVAGWLAWLGDGCNLVFNVVAVIWSASMVVSPNAFPPPLATVSGFVIALFAFKLAKVVCLYRSEVKATPLETLGAAVAGLALIHVVGRAVIAGLGPRRVGFYRTPKLARRANVFGAITAALPETLLAAALLTSALGVAAYAEPAGIDRTMWCALLVVFAIPHLAALALSLTAMLPGPRRRAPARVGAPATDARRG